MRKLFGILLVMALLVAGCGGGDGDGALGDQVFGGADTQTTQDTSDSGADDSVSDSDADSNTAGGGTLDDPTPEASGPLPSDSFRIGDAVWQRTIPTDGQCFVQEDDGTIPDSGTAWGSVNNDQAVEFRVSHAQDGSLEAQVSSDLMNWISGQKDGTELTIQLDFEASTMSGEGLFYNGHTDEWAYGSFAFTCTES